MVTGSSIPSHFEKKWCDVLYLSKDAKSEQMKNISVPIHSKVELVAKLKSKMRNMQRSLFHLWRIKESYPSANQSPLLRHLYRKSFSTVRIKSSHCFVFLPLNTSRWIAFTKSLAQLTLTASSTKFGLECLLLSDDVRTGSNCQIKW